MVVIVILFGPAVFNHVDEHFKILLLRRCFVDQVQNESRIQRDLGTLPKRIVLLCAFRRGVFYEVVDQFHHILIVLDVGKGIEAVRPGRVDQVEYLDDIAFLEQQRGYRPERFAFWVSHKKAAICLHQIWLHEKAGLTCAGAADHDLQQVAPVHFPVQAHADILCQDGVVAQVFVAVLCIEPLGTAPLGRAVFFSRPAVFAGRAAERHGKAIGDQCAQHKLERIRRPPDRQRMLHQP